MGFVFASVAIDTSEGLLEIAKSKSLFARREQNFYTRCHIDEAAHNFSSFYPW
jgi:hypothetical protein